MRKQPWTGAGPCPCWLTDWLAPRACPCAADAPPFWETYRQAGYVSGSVYNLCEDWVRWGWGWEAAQAAVVLGLELRVAGH